LKVLGYTRVSTNGQEDNTSIDIQLRSIAAYCESQQWKLVRCHSDVATGSNFNRPGFKKLKQELMENGFAGIVVYKLDRLSRSIVDGYGFIQELEKKDKFFISVTESQINTATPEGRLFLSMIFSFAEYERNIITKRMKEGREAKAREGIKSQGAVFGYRYDENKELIVVAEEAEKVQIFFKMYKQFQSLARVKHFLDTNNMQNRNGKNFSRQALHFMLNNKFYTGILIQGSIETSGKHIAIISKTMFTQVQKILHR
jgi:site-specific DNA recombinase